MRETIISMVIVLAIAAVAIIYFKPGTDSNPNPMPKQEQSAQEPDKATSENNETPQEPVEFSTGSDSNPNPMPKQEQSAQEPDKATSEDNETPQEPVEFSTGADSNPNPMPKQEQSAQEPDKATSENNEIPQKPVRFTTAESLAEEFMAVCAKANVNEMSSLYYEDMFDQIYQRTANNLSRENFDFLIAEEMKAIEKYELYKYGGEEMQASVSPLYYVNYFHYGSARQDTTLEESQVTDCATLRVYKADGSYSDHMLACIDGEWHITD